MGTTKIGDAYNGAIVGNSSLHIDSKASVDYLKVEKGHVENKGTIDLVYATTTDVKFTNNGTVDHAHTIASSGTNVKEYAEALTEKSTGVTFDCNTVYIESDTTVDHSSTGPASYQGADYNPDVTGALLVAADTGDTSNLPEAAQNYAAAINGVGYSTLQEAISAAKSGDTVSLLKSISLTSNMNSKSSNGIKDYSIEYTVDGTNTVGAALIISKNLTINGNGNKITTTSKGSFNKGVSIAVVENNVNLKLENITVLTTEMSNLYVGENAKNVSIELDKCVFETAYDYSYSIKTCNRADNLSLTINGSTINGWAAINMRSSNSTVNITNSDLSGDNLTRTLSTSDNFASLVIDGDYYYHRDQKVIGTYGSNNVVNISKTKISASTVLNEQNWMSIQYGAKNNTVIVDSNCTITNPGSWKCAVRADESDETLNAVVSSNTVLINGTRYNGIASKED